MYILKKKRKKKENWSFFNAVTIREVRLIFSFFYIIFDKLSFLHSTIEEWSRLWNIVHWMLYQLPLDNEKFSVTISDDIQHLFFDCVKNKILNSPN